MVALAQKSRDMLRITWRDATPDVDPYYNSLRTGMVLAFLAYDGLVYRDPVPMKIEPDLATSWTQVNPTTIDFTLRKGVTFQNGDPFTADDVVYTINDIIHDKQVAVPSYYRFLAGAKKNRYLSRAAEADRSVAGCTAVSGDGGAVLAEELP